MGADVPVPATLRQGAEVAEDLGAAAAPPAGRGSRASSSIALRRSSIARTRRPRWRIPDSSTTAGLWRHLRSGQWPAATKTKAHRARAEAQEAGDLAAWALNDWADKLANVASAQARVPGRLEDNYVDRRLPGRALAGGAPFPAGAQTGGRRRLGAPRVSPRHRLGGGRHGPVAP